MALSVDQVFRDFNSPNVPASGDHEPVKAEIRALLKQIQNSGGMSVTRNTLAALNGVTPPSADYMGIVLNDPNPANNGYYSRVGSAWVYGRGFPDTFARVILTGSGTAQIGGISAGVNPADIEVFYAKVETPNTGPLTLALNGVTRQVVNLAGNPLSAGEWTGMVMFCLNDANQYQLLIDAGAAASAATSAGAAAVDADRAEAAADESALSAAGASLVTGALPRLSRSAIKSLNTSQITVAYLIEEGRESMFQWRAGDYAERISADLDEAYFLKANAIASSSGAWVRTVGPVSTPRTAGKTSAGVDNISNNAIVGPGGFWDASGNTKARPVWTVGVDSPTSNINFYSIGLTGHYIHPSVDGAVIYGGRANYYSAIAQGANLSHVVGKDNLTRQISSVMFTDHSDLFLDAVNNQGGHGAIIGGSYHVGAGDNVAIMGGYQTQVWGDNAFMGGGFNNIIGDPARSTAEQAFTAVLGGTQHNIKGQYQGIVGGLAHKMTRQTGFSGALAGWNHDFGDTASRNGMAAVGGRNGRIVAENAVLLGGENNTITTSGPNAVAMGRRAVAAINSSFVQASGRFANDGDAQTEQHTWFGVGAGVVLPGAGGAGGDTKQMPLGTVCGFQIFITGARSDVPGEYYSYIIKGMAQNVGGTAVIVTQSLEVLHETDASFNANAEIFGTRLGVRCTGVAGKTVRWVVSARLTSLNVL